MSMMPTESQSKPVELLELFSNHGIKYKDTGGKIQIDRQNNIEKISQLMNDHPKHVALIMQDRGWKKEEITNLYKRLNENAQCEFMEQSTWAIMRGRYSADFWIPLFCDAAKRSEKVANALFATGLHGEKAYKDIVRESVKQWSALKKEFLIKELSKVHQDTDAVVNLLDSKRYGNDSASAELILGNPDIWMSKDKIDWLNAFNALPEKSKETVLESLFIRSRSHKRQDFIYALFTAEVVNGPSVLMQIVEKFPQYSPKIRDILRELPKGLGLLARSYMEPELAEIERLAYAESLKPPTTKEEGVIYQLDIYALIAKAQEFDKGIFSSRHGFWSFRSEGVKELHPKKKEILAELKTVFSSCGVALVEKERDELLLVYLLGKATQGGGLLERNKFSIEKFYEAVKSDPHLNKGFAPVVTKLKEIMSYYNDGQLELSSDFSQLPVMRKGGAVLNAFNEWRRKDELEQAQGRGRGRATFSTTA